MDTIQFHGADSHNDSGCKPVICSVFSDIAQKNLHRKYYDADFAEALLKFFCFLLLDATDLIIPIWIQSSGCVTLDYLLACIQDT